jgi:inorganic triphosphatase YgiF
VADTQREIESKFDVAPDFAVGDLTDLLADGDSLDASDNDLTSVYYDTPDGDLLRSRLTLRRRTGTSDTGWHLKVPGAGFRTELRWPLAGNDVLPDELRRLVTPFTHGNDVHPVVSLRVHRIRHTVRTALGGVRFEIADDQVWATELDDRSLCNRRWHEVEVELGADGDYDDLARASEQLLDRGAFVSTSPSKLARALVGEPKPPVAPGTAAGTVLTYLVAQADAITAGHFAISLMPFDPEATSEPHEAVHQTRVAIRRYRAALRVFAELFDHERAASLERELKWFATELGEVRDREVVRLRLARAVDDLPAFLVVGPVGERIDQVLLGELHMHAEALLHTMRHARYHDLLDELALWRTEAPFTPAAGYPDSTLGEYVSAAQRKLAKRMRQAGKRQATEDELHFARKAGKRARYAAEASSQAGGAEATELVKTASALQMVLGEYQDAVTATALLRRIADQIADEGENAFTYGILVADQRRSAAESAEAARQLAKS